MARFLESTFGSSESCGSWRALKPMPGDIWRCLLSALSLVLWQLFIWLCRADEEKLLSALKLPGQKRHKTKCASPGVDSAACRWALTCSWNGPRSSTRPWTPAVEIRSPSAADVWGWSGFPLGLRRPLDGAEVTARCRQCRLCLHAVGDYLFKEQALCSRALSRRGNGLLQTLHPVRKHTINLRVCPRLTRKESHDPALWSPLSFISPSHMWRVGQTDVEKVAFLGCFYFEGLKSLFRQQPKNPP